MKKLLTILTFLIVTLTIQATTYYVSTTGTDGSGHTGLVSDPWHSLHYACTRVTSGDVITVGAGTFAETTNQAIVPVGVSIVGQGVTSIITYTYAGADYSTTTNGCVVLSSGSPTSTNGNQSISYLSFSGSSWTATRAIAVDYRNNVEIHHCTFTNFYYSAVSFFGTPTGYPAITTAYHSTGNSFHDCIVNNCSKTLNGDGGSGGNYGHLLMTGQDGTLIYNNTFDNTGLPTNYMGDTWNTMLIKNIKFYNNVLSRSNDVSPWNFFSENMETEGGLEVYGNTFNGNATLDIVDIRPGSSGFGCKIHDNTWQNTSQPALNSHTVQCIDFEERGAIQQVFVYYNHFKNTETPIQFDVNCAGADKVLISGGVSVDHCYVYYNLIEGLGNTTNNYSLGIALKPYGSYTYATTYDNIYIDNNTIVSGSSHRGYAGISLETTPNMTNIYIRNNIVQGSSYGILYTYAEGTPSGSTHYIQDNLLYANTSSNAVGFSGVTVSGINYTPSGGVVSTSNPSFYSSSDFHLSSSGSPAYHAGIHISSPIAYGLDIVGVSIYNPPSLGAYEYGSVTSPTVTTTAITGIGTTTATSGGNVTSDGGASVTSKGVCWGLSSNPTTSNSLTNDGTGTGSYVSSITGLSASTTYHVRAYAINSQGTSYGSDVSFTTLSVPVIPTVTTTPVIGIGTTTAVGAGNITSDGGASITAKGVCWNTLVNPTTANAHTSDGIGIGSFASSIVGLTANTTYHVRAYATNSVGTAYGADLQFTTAPVIIAPTVTTISVSGVTISTATTGGNVTSDGGGTVIQRGVAYSISSNPTIAGNYTSDGTGTGIFTSSLTGLMPNTLYYVRAYAINSAGTSYGSQVTFTTTSTQTVPVLTTSAPTVMATTFITIGGNITSDGGSSVTARGVCWGLAPGNTISGSHTSDGTGTGLFVSSITGLTRAKPYFIRAYATNSTGTAYGQEVLVYTAGYLIFTAP
jgi:hypothetical protein